MQKAAFGDYPRGTLHAMLAEAYAANEPLSRVSEADWRTFDDFVYDNLSVLERCGFISMQAGAPAGFITWDPRPLPGGVIIGHNCILPAYRGRGRGKEQLGAALAVIRTLRPGEVTVSTGGSGFFLPARRMYEALGFRETGRTLEGPPPEPELVLYRLVP